MSIEPKEWRKQFKTKRLKAIGNDPLMEVSYHEAGHSLIHLLYGIMPGPVTIIPDEQVEPLLEKVKKVDEINKEVGIRAFVWEITSVV